ncbi:MAG: tRNA pseudouridine(55) synthase TruB [Clostridia bacterium]|nr:tRNA pseudouridine(55) synthase TruB [Clostridia bacterium]
MEIKGFININKPANMTSSDVVVKVRGILHRVTGEKIKVGHLGTLDPQATGVLPIAIGTATKLFDFALKKQKEYIASFTFGKQTDTLDCEGKFLVENKKIPTKEEIIAILPCFVGDIMQVPPQYSAKSINGKRAYDLAREGKNVELGAKSVTVFSIELLDEKYLEENNDIGYEKTDSYIFKICCGSGTYIRSLARDIGEKTDTVAYMSSLIRNKSGEFILDNSVKFEEFEQNPLNFILPIETILNGLPKYNFPEPLAEKFLNGIKVTLEIPQGEFRVYHNNSLLGIGKNEQGNLKLVRL